LNRLAGRWRVIAPHLDQALELPPAERAAWLSSLEPALAADLRALLEQQRSLEQKGFLERGPLWRPAVGTTVGAYTLTSLIGEGGMGSVWLARRHDGRFEGQAAVKLLDTALVSRAAEERLKREGSILARLQHPNIAHLMDAGVSEAGQPYLLLEYVDGRPIDRYCEEHQLAPAARIRLFLDVLAAVAHAHANLIVHRDLKPPNVLVSRDGRVKLLDFGVAKLLEGESPAGIPRLSREGAVPLTPAYAAPEQLSGGPVTTATDIYSLGLLLQLLVPGREVAAVVERALRSNPAERHASAAAFAEDLRRCLRPRPRRVRLVAAAALVALLGVATTTYTRHEEARRLDDAVELSGVYAELAALHRHDGRPDIAASFEAKRLALWRQWQRALPHHPTVLRQLAMLKM
jgi:eukaryotic-like serine/threonine-protein kinase